MNTVLLDLYLNALGMGAAAGALLALLIHLIRLPKRDLLDGTIMIYAFVFIIGLVGGFFKYLDPRIPIPLSFTALVGVILGGIVSWFLCRWLFSPK